MGRCRWTCLLYTSGSPVSLYLAAAGVGTIGIADFDRVDVSNLQRQILYREQDIGKAKAELAAEQLQSRNHSVQVELYPEGITAENAEEILAKFDVIVDASDNFPTRYLPVSYTHLDVYKRQQHVRPIGEDIVAGEMLMPGYHEIRPIDIGVLLSGGITEIEVLKKPSIRCV